MLKIVVTNSQFHQHFKSSFCTDNLLQKKIQSQTVIRKNLRKALSCKNCSSKMLMKLTLSFLSPTFNKTVQNFTKHFELTINLISVSYALEKVGTNIP
jgi:hypothetical protein